MIPFIPYSYPDESPASFLTRLAFDIGHDNVLDMVRPKSGIKSYRTLTAVFAQPERYRSLMNSLGIFNDFPHPVNIGLTRGTSHRIYDGCNISLPNFRGELEAFCPDCIKCNPYWKRRWSLRIYTICETHGCKLQDCCQNCKLPLTFNRGCIYICSDCEFDLKKTKSVYVNTSTILSAKRLFSPKINADECELVNKVFTCVDKTLKDLATDSQKMHITRMLIERPKTGTSKLVEILSEATLYTHQRIQCLPLLLNSNTVQATESALKKLGDVDLSKAKNWNPVKLTLSETAKVLNISFQVVQKLLKWNILSAEGKNSARRISSNALVPLLGRKPEELRKLIDKADGNSGDNLRYVDRAKVAELLNLNKTIVCGLIKSNHLTTVVKMLNGYQRNTVDVKSVERFRKNYVTPGFIAEKFGVKKQTVSMRLQTLKIHPVAGPSIDGAVTNIFKISDLRKLTKTAVLNAKIYSRRNKLSHVKFEEDSYITLKAAAAMLGIPMRAASKLTRIGILNRIDAGYKGIRVETASVKKLLKTINDPIYSRLEDVRRMAALDATSFWHYFISTEIIKVVNLFSWHLIHQRYVDKVIAFTTSYVTEMEGIKMLGAGTKALTNLRLKNKVKFKRFKGPKNDVYFYLRKSIEDLMEDRRELNVK